MLITRYLLIHYYNNVIVYHRYTVVMGGLYVALKFGLWITILVQLFAWSLIGDYHHCHQSPSNGHTPFRMPTNQSLPCCQWTSCPSHLWLKQYNLTMYLSVKLIGYWNTSGLVEIWSVITWLSYDINIDFVRSWCVCVWRMWVVLVKEC